jgi:hypothetical protein
MRALPVHRQYPVPWFVVWLNGEPEFRAMDVEKWVRAVKEKLCWVCGQRLGVHVSFTVGPMCLVTFTTSEPPSHWDCATWSAKNCPFLSRPKMVRREAGMPDAAEAPPGISIDRNPGVAAVYTVTNYEVFSDGGKPPKPLIQMSSECEHVEWYSEGRPATRAEVEHSVETGLPYLMAVAETEGSGAVADLERRVGRFWSTLLPKE